MSSPTSGQFWDTAFGDLATYKYGQAPNAFLRSQVQHIPAGARVLVPGDGEGRNGVWLAQQGFTVQTVDASAVGIAKAQQLAQARGVRIQAEQADFNDWSVAAQQYDAVVLTYVHLPPPLRRRLHAQLWQALKPGGVLILEGFHPRQLPLNSGGPKDEAMLFTLERLRPDFAGAQELLAEEVATELAEGPGHAGWAEVTRLVLCQPN